MRILLLSMALLSIAACAPQPPTTVAWPLQPPGPTARLALSNFTFPGGRVVAVVTTNGVCDTLGSGIVSATELALPLNATRVIEVPPGADVCWHRNLAADPDVSDAAVLRARWNRAFLSTVGPVDTRM